MRRFTFVLLAALAAPAAFAALEWPKQTLAIEAGVLDEKTEAVFAFANTGSTAITITEVASHCGCTVASLEKRTYAPGEKGEIRAIYSFNGSVGRQSKVVTVTTDEKGTHEYTLTLDVTIPQLFEVNPAFVVWKRGDATEPRSIAIRVTRPELAQIVSAESQDTRFTVSLEKVEGAPGLYRVHIAPHDTEIAMQMSVVVKSNFPAKDPRVITLYGLVR